MQYTTVHNSIQLLYIAQVYLHYRNHQLNLSSVQHHVSQTFMFRLLV